MLIDTQLYNIDTKKLTEDSSKLKLNSLKTNVLPAFSMSFLLNTFDSLNGLSEVLIRQNEILLKIHPLIRNIVLKSQENKISYLNEEI